LRRRLEYRRGADGAPRPARLKTLPLPGSSSPERQAILAHPLDDGAPMRVIRALTLSSLLLACGPSATGPTTPNAPSSPAVAATVQGSNGQGSNGQGSNGD